MMKQNSVALVETLPALPGIYILSLPNEVLYVGESVNLRQRWKAHQLRCFIRLPEVTLHHEVRGDHKQRERELIEQLRPSFNGRPFSHARSRYKALTGYQPPSYVESDPGVVLAKSVVAMLTAIRHQIAVSAV